MAKQEEPGFDPEEIFNEGVQYQQQQDDTELREQIAEQMIASGLNPDEVEQTLFSEGTDVYAPRRGRRGRSGKRKCSAKQWAKMPQVCRGTKGARVRTARHPVMVYDPAPPGGYRAAATRYYKKRGGAKGIIAGLRPLILPGATLATVYGKYQERAEKLKASGATLDGKPVDGVWMALMYDLENRPVTSVMDRMKENASEIISPALMGVGLKYGAKKVKLHPKVNQVASLGGDALIGVAIGKVISTFLDPPNPVTNMPARRQMTGQPPVVETTLDHMPMSMRGY